LAAAIPCLHAFQGASESSISLQNKKTRAQRRKNMLATN